MPSHQLSMDQIKFKDCAFSVGLRNWGMSFCDFWHFSTQEPKENRQMHPRIKVALAFPSFLLFIKLHWQYLVLCWHSSPLWSSWVKCQWEQLAPLSHGAIPHAEGWGWTGKCCFSAQGCHFPKTTFTLLSVGMLACLAFSLLTHKLGNTSSVLRDHTDVCEQGSVTSKSPSPPHPFSLAVLTPYGQTSLKQTFNQKKPPLNSLNDISKVLEGKLKGEVFISATQSTLGLRDTFQTVQTSLILLLHKSAGHSTGKASCFSKGTVHMPC